MYSPFPKSSSLKGKAKYLSFFLSGAGTPHYGLETIGISKLAFPYLNASKTMDFNSPNSAAYIDFNKNSGGWSPHIGKALKLMKIDDR